MDITAFCKKMCLFLEGNDVPCIEHLYGLNATILELSPIILFFLSSMREGGSMIFLYKTNYFFLDNEDCLNDSYTKPKQSTESGQNNCQ